MTLQHASNNREMFTLLGSLESKSLIPWIERHCCKLGLEETILQVEANRVAFSVEGPPELLDTMEMGCSLGPIDVWVETIERHPA